MALEHKILSRLPSASQKRARLSSLFALPRQRPRYVEEISKSSSFSVKGLLSSLIRHENGAFRKRSSTRRNLKTPALRFRVDKKHFENGICRKRWRHDNHVISLPKFSSNTNPKWPVIVVFLNSSGVAWIGLKHVMRFHIEISVCKFLCRSPCGWGLGHM